MTPGIRDRARDALRAEIADVAFDVFAARGFDGATVDDVARRAGISRATFFRYFSSKEDAVVTAVSAGRTSFGAVLTSLAPVPGETPWDGLTRVFESCAAGVEGDQERLRLRLRMITSTPSLRTRLGEKWRTQEQGLVEALTGRGVDPERARMLAVAALCAYDVAWREWAGGSRATPADAVSGVFAAFRHLGAAV